MRFADNHTLRLIRTILSVKRAIEPLVQLLRNDFMYIKGNGGAPICYPLILPAISLKLH